MFENLLGQDDAVRRIRNDLESNSLPPSLLFEGPPLSAKATAALELSRATSCARGAPWNCSCEHCSRHRLLAHPDLLLFGPKNLREELSAAADMLARAPGDPARYFFIRAARKLARRFDQALYEGEEAKLSKALPLVRTLLEASDACMPGASADEEAAKEAAKALPSCAKLHDLIPDSTPVYQIRAMESWARQTPLGERKTIIIEHADRMLDASRNALLKILEEPPSFARFILTTSRKQAMIPTILSRVRGYRFLPRGLEPSRMVLERVFKIREEVEGGLEGFFGKFRPEGSDRVTLAARDFAAALASAFLERTGGQTDQALSALAAKAQGSYAQAIAMAAKASANFGSGDDALAWSFPSFLDEAGKVFSSLFRQEAASSHSLAFAELYADLARDALMRYSAYNMNPVALAERLAERLTASAPIRTDGSGPGGNGRRRA